MDQSSPSLDKKATLTRHQSLLVQPVHNLTSVKSSDGSSLTDIRRKILATLSERREIAERPEDLNVSGNDKIELLLINKRHNKSTIIIIIME